MRFSIRTDLAAIAVAHPELHRETRRYPAPVQLALAALEDVRGLLEVPAEAALISVAPTEGGSPEIHGWVRQIAAASREAKAPPRMNPTHTLHVVDNLALSAASIRLGNRQPGWGLGGGPGQAWEALALADELLASGVREVVILAADQDDVAVASPAIGLALVLQHVAEKVSYTLIHDHREKVSYTLTADNGARGLAAWLEAR